MTTSSDKKEWINKCITTSEINNLMLLWEDSDSSLAKNLLYDKTTKLYTVMIDDSAELQTLDLDLAIEEYDRWD